MGLFLVAFWIVSELFWYWTVEVGCAVLCAVFTAENVVRSLFVNLVLNVSVQSLPYIRDKESYV